MTEREHGTLARYKNDHCQCGPCQAASRDYDNRRARLIAYGRWQPYVDAEPVRDHLRMLAENGIGFKRAAEYAGLAPSSVAKILYGAASRGMGPSKRVRAETAAGLLAIRPSLEPLADTSLTDGSGTRRRLQALVVAGWPQSRLAARLGMTQSALNKLINSDKRVYAATARAATALFDELWDQPPPEWSHRERIAASRARNTAAARGWAPALAWDDDLIDLPEAELAAELERRAAAMDDAEARRCERARAAGDRSPLILAGAREHKRRRNAKDRARYQRTAAHETAA